MNHEDYDAHQLLDPKSRESKYVKRRPLKHTKHRGSGTVVAVCMALLFLFILAGIEHLSYLYQ